MFVKNIIDEKGPELITIHPSDHIRHVAQLFKRERIGFALVVSEMGGLLGTVSERDIVQAFADKGDLSDLPVVDIMTANIVTCALGDSLESVRDIMTSRCTRHVVVMQGSDTAGIVSIGDLIKHSLNECRIDSEQMRDYISGHGYQ